VTARTRDLDVAGALTATLGLSAIVYGIVRTEAIGWGAPQTLGALAVGLALLLAFVVIEARVARAPLVPLGIFRSRQLRAANVGMLLLSASLFALWYFLSLFFREVLGYSAIEAGLAFLPITVGFALGSTQAAKVIARIGLRPTLTLGFVLSAIGIWWFSRMGVNASYVRDVLAPSIVVALGMGTTMVPLTTAGVAGVARHETGLASGLVNVQRQVGGALGLAILATLAASRTGDVLSAAHGGGAALARVALADGFQRAFEVSAAFSLVGAIAVLLMMRRATVAAAEAVEPRVAAQAARD
jgi:predicted MFS family arabinose efflux permease